ncbi:hypothetical protein BST97_04345 [Nonlabens spongiae]|uniref:Uncharacterized protein n=2 Tax=Nonlabens spongiae TaxID=331648 RepID=A0A1W6MI57_9FLAO|nr:hypothetical protein BST97_04345 [Nonlabens spongiae]
MDLVTIDNFQGESFIGRRIVILDNDTLVDQTPEIDTPVELSPKITNKEIMADYFYMTTISKKSRLAWWKKPIVIHLSDDFDEEIIEDLKSFVDSINATETVQINFSDTKEGSNLMILNHKVTFSSDLLKNLNDFPKQKILFYYTTYSLYRVDSEIDHGFIKIDLDRTNNSQEIKRSLRRTLYASLGYFIGRDEISRESLLYRKSERDADLNDYDRLLLQVHYDHLTDYRVNTYDLYELFWKKY